MRYRLRLLIGLFVFLSACTTASFSPTLAPQDVPVWETPAEMPRGLYTALEGKYFQYVAQTVDMQLYRDLFVHFPNGIEPLPVSLPELVNARSRFSRDGRYYAYILWNVQWEGSIDEIGIVDLWQKQRHMLLYAQDIPGVQAATGVAFGPENRYLVVGIMGKNFVDLLRIDLPSGEFRRLNVSAPLTPWTTLDVGPDGSIVAQCYKVRPDGKVEIYLCLLDAEGNLVRTLTPPTIFGETYQGSSGRFTPDGQWIIYDVDYRLYKVSRHGGEPQEIAPCTVNGAVWVTETHALTPCYLNVQPLCYALYAASLDGTSFYRLGFIPEVCPAVRATQEAQQQ